MQKGDIVGRLSYNCDIIFIIKDIKDDIAYLSGIYVRLFADSLLSDLRIIPDNELIKYNEEDLRKQNNIIEGYKSKMGHITGKILHYDSDSTYLDKCLNLYKSLNIYAVGIVSKEEDMASSILKNIKRYRPNIVILTGHDSYNKQDIKELNNYKNTIHFMKAVLKIREHYSLDDISVFAGACGSNFEAIIASGANFASSIDRGNIEAYDPAIVGILSSITPIDQVVDIKSLYNFSKMKKGSIGGVETYGKMRLLMR